MALFSILVDIASKTASFEEGMRRVESRLDSFSSRVKESAKAIAEFGGLSLTAAGFAEFAKSAIESATAIQAASERAGASVAEFSKLKFAADQNDISFEALTVGIKKFQDVAGNAAGNNSKAAESLARLNIQVTQLRGLKLSDQLALIADGFKGLTNAEDRTSVAQGLFGRSGQELVPLLEKGKDGLDQLTEAADKLGITLDERATAALNRSEKALSSYWSAIKSFTSNTAGGLAADLFGSGSELLDLEAKLEKLKELQRQADKGFIIPRTTFGDMAAWKKANNDAIEATEKSIDAIKHRKEAEADLAQAQESLSRELRERIDGDIIVQQKGIDALLRSLEPLQEVFTTVRHRDTAPLKSFYDELDHQTQTAVERQVEAWNKAEVAIETLQQDGIISAEEAAKRTSETMDNFLQEFVVTAKRRNDEVKKPFGTMFQYAEQAARSAQQAMADFFFDPMQTGLKGLLKSWIDVLRRMVAEAAAAQLFKYLFGESRQGDTSSGLASGLGSFLGSFFGGGKASGGPLDQGKWYIAGEHGPEAIWGGGSGAYAAGYGGMQGAPITIVNNIQIGANNAVSRAEVAQAMKISSDSTVGRIQDMRRRGKL